MRCKECGGECTEIKRGEYRCAFCGSTFRHEEAPAKATAYSQKSDGADVFEDNINSILEIYWEDDRYTHSGSGFLISKDLAITNAHVVTKDSGKPALLLDVKIAGEIVRATVVALGDNQRGAGGGIDLALIKLLSVPNAARAAKFEDFENVRIGEKVYVIGNSLGYGTCITSGIVSDKERTVNGRRLLMTDCAVNNGNSGGPVFNEKGLVIGAIVSGFDNAEGMNFAIPAHYIQDFIKHSR